MRTKWTLEKCLEIAQKYKSLKDFRKNHNDAFCAARRNGWSSKVFKDLTKNDTKWKFKSAVIDEARKYSSINEFRKNSKGAYESCKKNKWDSEAFSHMIQKTGFWNDIDKYRETKYKEKWLLIITTDHGRDEKNGKNHGGQSPRQRSTWIVSNKKLNNYAHLDYPAIVDIMPTLSNFMGMKLPSELAKEIDGIPLIGKVSVAQPAINVFQQKLDLRWQSLDTSGTVKIWLCTKNEFKTGALDQYILLKEVPNQNSKAIIDISQYPSDFYKIALEGKYNTINKWFVQNAK